jgi:hypothetical protein
MLVEYAKRNPDASILYIAYNKALAIESSCKFTDCSHVRVSTIHAFALEAFADDFFWVEDLGIDKVRSLFPDITLEESRVRLKAFERYCASDDREPGDQYTQAIWDAMFNEKNTPVSHDAYLKAYQLLAVQTVAFDVVLVDEIQDFTDCMLDIVCNFDCSKLFVGDIHQKIYGFKNVGNPHRYILNHPKLNEVKKMRLTRTFRFGYDLMTFVNSFVSHKFHTSGFKTCRSLNTTVGMFSSYNDISSKTVVITRYNVTIFETMFELAREQMRFHVLGGLMVNINEEILEMKKLIDFEPFDHFQTIEDFIEHVYTVRDSMWMVRVNLFVRHGSAVLDMLALASEYITDDGGIGLITAHRSKGLEFEDVAVADDFNINSLDECSVMYVALSRAKSTLRVPRAIINYMFQKHVKLKFEGESKHAVCSICKRKKHFRGELIEDDAEVVLTNRCELYFDCSVCASCRK